MGLVAFVGGIDLTKDRWDTVLHDQSALRQRTGIAKKDGNLGWVDASVRISGRAAKDVATNFLSRWNMQQAPLQDDTDELSDVQNPPYSALPAIDQDEPLMLVSAGTHAVQLMRTYSCKYKYYTDFAPRGEISYFHGSAQGHQERQELRVHRGPVLFVRQGPAGRAAHGAAETAARDHRRAAASRAHGQDRRLQEVPVRHDHATAAALSQQGTGVLDQGEPQALHSQQGRDRRRCLPLGRLCQLERAQHDAGHGARCRPRG
ncbi:hypothetical protein PINS_up005437 [Pythium insidiosum]|nr:hypothetical protein PINS_up005437 [Pythium insidiosum]